MFLESPMLIFDGVSKSYQEMKGKLDILNEISFTIKEKETIALMGASGSGKSTLLSLAGMMDKPDAGQIHFSLSQSSIDPGIHISNIHQENDGVRSLFRRKYLGFVFQNFNLMSCLNVKDNMLFQRRLCRLKDDDDWVAKLIDVLELNAVLSQRPDQLSGGQQQRVAIARALAHKPALILADEPTGSLDDRLSHQVMDLLMELISTLQASLLLVTHSLEIADYCQIRWSLQKGQLVK